MFIHLLKGLKRAGLLLAVMGFTQEIPIYEPHLLPFPALSGGISFFSLVPTQNLQLNSTPSGWDVSDTLPGLAVTVDLELIRYRWWDHLSTDSRFDAYSTLGYSIFNQIGSRGLPSTYPSSFELNKQKFYNFSMNALIKELYLDHRFIYRYGRRGSLHASLATGLTSLSLYKNGDGVRVLQSNGLGLHVGLGWKLTLLGRVGERIRLGVDLGYSWRGFDLSEPDDDNLKLIDGSSGDLSPIQSIAFNTPDIAVNVEFGESLFAANTPYRDPYKLGLLNFSIGMGLISFQQGVTIQYDSSGQALSMPFYGSVSQNYNLQIFKYNWPFHFIKQANIDAFSGLGVRYWRNSQRTPLPTGWAREFTDGSSTFSGMQFSPKILDLYLRHEFIYPLGLKMHSKINAGTGFAMMTLYENGALAKAINASGITWQLGGGLNYVIQGDGSSKVTLGLSLGYVHQAFDIDMANNNFSAVNASEITPITHIDLSQATLSLDIGLLFGGNSNIATKAHQAFKDKDFTQAIEFQQELLNLYPNHHNKKAVLIEKQMVEDTLVTLYYHDVYEVLSQGKLQSAYSLVQQGKAPPTKGVETAVQGMKREISNRALERAAEALKNLDYLQAEEMILLALKSDPTSAHIAKVLLARSYIIRATILHQSGIYGRSLYWLKRADGLTDRYQSITDELRLKIGDGRLDDANEGILKQDREMVYQSMQEAKALNPVLTDLVDEHLSSLEAAMEYKSDQEIGGLKRMALDNLLDDISGLDPESFTPHLGMSGAVLAKYVGPPRRRFEEGDYELWVYPRPEEVELWLYLRDGLIEKIEYQK